MDDGFLALGGLAGAALLGQLARRRRRRAGRPPPGRLKWAGGALTEALLETSVLATGQTGSGKSSAMAVLARELLESGCGLYAPAAKPDDLPKLLDLCRRAGRERDVTVVDHSGAVSTNFFAELLTGRDHGTESVLLADGLGQVCQCLRRQAGGGGEDGAFWQAGSDRMTRANLHLQLLAGVVPTVQTYLEVMQTAPRTPADLADPAWQRGTCSRLLAAAYAAAKADPGLAPDFDQVSAYHTRELPGLADRTRSCFEAVTLGPVDVLTKGAVARVLSSPAPTLDLDAIVRGNKVLLTDFSPGRDRGIAVAVNTALKYLIQLKVLARTVPPGARPFVLYLDEFSQVTSSFDVEYAALQRSAKGPMVCLVQGVEFLRRCYPGDDAAVETLSGNLAVKVACGPQTKATAAWLCETLGSRLGVTASGSSSNTYADLADLWNGPRQQSSGGFSESMLPLLTPGDLARLRSGGAANGRVVDVLVYAAGADFGGEPFTVREVKQP